MSVVAIKYSTCTVHYLYLLGTVQVHVEVQQTLHDTVFQVFVVHMNFLNYAQSYLTPPPLHPLVSGTYYSHSEMTHHTGTVSRDFTTLVFLVLQNILCDATPPFTVFFHYCP
jgi:hypothetical protein